MTNFIKNTIFFLVGIVLFSATFLILPQVSEAACVVESTNNPSTSPTRWRVSNPPQISSSEPHYLYYDIKFSEPCASSESIKISIAGHETGSLVDFSGEELDATFSTSLYKIYMNNIEDYSVSMVEVASALGQEAGSSVESFSLEYRATEENCDTAFADDCWIVLEMYDSNDNPIHYEGFSGNGSVINISLIADGLGLSPNVEIGGDDDLDFTELIGFAGYLYFGSQGIFFDSYIIKPGMSYNCSGPCTDNDGDYGDGKWQITEILPYEEETINSNIAVGTADVGGDYDSEYKPLAPLPGFENVNNLTIGPFLATMFNLIILLVGILSIIMIIFGGIQYMTTDAISGKQEGKERITNAVIGLILALGSFLILRTINPNLVNNFNLGIPTVTLDGPDQAWLVAGEGDQICKGKKLGGADILVGANWPADTTARDALAAVGVSVSNDANDGNNCAGPIPLSTNAASCTSVYFEGNSANIPDRIINLKVECPGCEIVVTGGSECWFHSSHGPNKRKIDLRITPTLNEFIRIHGGGNPSDFGDSGNEFPNNGKTYTIPTIGKFKAEKSGETSNTTSGHWHVKLD